MAGGKDRFQEHAHRKTVYLITILILSFPSRFIGWISPVLTWFVECYYFGFSMLDYNSERNKLSARRSIEFISLHKGLAIGNGLVFYLMHLVPVAGWILHPSYAVLPPPQYRQSPALAGHYR